MGWNPKAESTKADNLKLIHAQWYNQMTKDLSILHTTGLK